LDFPRLFQTWSHHDPNALAKKNSHKKTPAVDHRNANETNTKAKEYKSKKQNKHTMKLVFMITAALAGNVADWDYWGSFSSLFTKNTTKNTKNMFRPSLQQDEIAAILTPPPSIFLPGYTVLNSSAPLLFILHVVNNADVASFDLTTINSPFLKDLMLLSSSSISFGETLGRVVPSAGEFLAMKIQVQEGIAAQVRHWMEFKTVAAQTVRRWTMEFLQAHTSILSRFVWDLMTVSETIWQWRFVLQALTLVIRWSAASTTPWMSLVLVPKVLLATLRAFDVPHQLFAAAFPPLDAAYRLIKMIYGFYKAYGFLRACWNAARKMRRIRSIRTMMAVAIRTLANWVMRQLVAVLWSLVRAVFLWMAALIGFYLLFLR
jgi:hypothetical protein